MTIVVSVIVGVFCLGCLLYSARRDWKNEVDRHVIFNQQMELLRSREREEINDVYARRVAAAESLLAETARMANNITPRPHILGPAGKPCTNCGGSGREKPTEDVVLSDRFARILDLDLNDENDIKRK